MRKKRRVLSIVVAVVMTIAMMPASAFASTNLDGMTEMQKEAVKDNYWAELNAYKDPSLLPEVFPDTAWMPSNLSTPRRALR